MITVIFTVNNSDEFGNLKRSIINLSPDWGLGLDILCLVGDKRLFPIVKDYLLESVDLGTVRTKFVARPSFKQAEELVGDNKYVFLADWQRAIPYGILNRLLRLYLGRPGAGFVTNSRHEVTEIYWVKDIYGEAEFVRLGQREIEKPIVEIDTAYPRNILTQTNLFKELFCSEDLPGYKVYSYGIKLRRQGYTNLLDTGIVV